MFRQLCIFTLVASIHAFVPMVLKTKSTTRLYLENRIADLIDGEVHRQQNKQQFEREWMEKNRGAIFKTFSDSSRDEDQEEVFRQQYKDRKLARDDPARYCADRCVATGNCDVYQDFFDFGPEEVLKFCHDCVLSDDDEPCDIPDSFYNDLKQLKP